ncbi:MAG: hypothetical protein ACOC93_04660, partial [Planctomycetota bacterium]
MTCCNDHHDHEPDLDAQQSQDPAGQSLANALRVSFRLLSVIMVLVVLAFFGTGVENVEEGQVGLKKVFGRVTGEVSPGLRLNWPFPIGEIELISTKQKTLAIDEFWMHETPEMASVTSLSEKARKVREDGLRPGWDGALLTGDRNLYHVKLACSYQVGNARDYATNVGSTERAEQILD